MTDIQLTDIQLPAAEWTALEQEHEARWDRYLIPAADRRTRGIKHPVTDFLFNYYPVRFSHLRRWHPGVHVTLQDSAHTPRAGWKWYTSTSQGGTRVDTPAYLKKNLRTVKYVAELLRATLARPGQFNCFGMHEWAMVYGLKPGEQRHEDLPLRLSNAEVDEVVDTHQLRCTHIDAYRFFTPPASPKNQHALTRANQPDFEQPGCLHANMDLYKWALKLGPIVPGELLFEAFELAHDIRQVDMQASPYDVSSFQLPAIEVDTSGGKAEYVQAQRGFTMRANQLRAKLLKITDFVLEHSALH